MRPKRGRRSGRHNLEDLQAEIRRVVEALRANPDFAFDDMRDELDPPTGDEHPYPGQIRCHVCRHFYSRHLRECPYRGCHAPNLGGRPVVSGAFAAWAN